MDKVQLRACLKIAGVGHKPRFEAQFAAEAGHPGSFPADACRSVERGLNYQTRY